MKQLLLLLLLATCCSAETYVLSVGVEQYDDGRVSSLKYAVADARSIAAAFRASGVPRDNVTVLTSAEKAAARRPTRIALITQLQRIRDRAQPSDRVVFFFAGHGIEENGVQYLLTVDTRRDMVSETALPLELVNKALEGLQAGELLCIIDACRNNPDAARGDEGAQLTEGLIRGVRPRRLEAPDNTQPTVTATLLSCDVGQRAYEDPEHGHGVFTVQLLKGLTGEAAGDDGQVHLKLLTSYVLQQVALWSRRSGREQTPRLINPSGGDMVVLKPADEPLVSIDARNSTLADVVAEIADQVDAQVVFGEGADPAAKVSGHLELQPLSTALRVLLMAHRLTVREQDGTYIIERPGATPAPTPQPSVPAPTGTAGPFHRVSSLPVSPGLSALPSEFDCFGAPQVVKVGNQYRLYFRCFRRSLQGSAAVAVSVSQDGVTWGPARIVYRCKPGNLNYLFVTHDEQGWMLCYTLNEPRVLWYFVLSTDGYAWGKNMGIVPPSSRGSSCCPAILRENGIWRAWFHNYDGTGRGPLWYSESPDGRSWSPGRGVLQPGAKGSSDEGRPTMPCVVKANGLYHLFFAEAVPGVPYRIAYASSPDGLTWTRHGRVLAASAAGSWDEGYNQLPCVLVDDDRVRLWYEGLRYSVVKDAEPYPSNIGYAEAPLSILAGDRPATASLDPRDGVPHNGPKPSGWPDYLPWPIPGVSNPDLRFRVCEKDSMPQVLIPAGEFTMGSPDEAGEPDEHPQRQIYVSAFWMDLHEVTVAQYRRFCDGVGGVPPPGNISAAFPVLGVSWNGAAQYAWWVGRELPTEAQWEKAARGGAATAYPWGRSWDANRANSSGRPMAVGSYPPGAFGLLDMVGNAYEWCRDTYSDSWYGRMPSHDPLGQTKSKHGVLRGGSWICSPNDLRLGARHWSLPDAQYDDFGFRCASPAD